MNKYAPILAGFRPFTNVESYNKIYGFNLAASKMTKNRKDSDGSLELLLAHLSKNKIEDIPSTESEICADMIESLQEQYR